MKELRDETVEKDLQNCLDAGHRVWAVGDVHGFGDSLHLLLQNLHLSSEDRVVLLGDLIDRGPSSFDVIRLARSDPRIHCVKGNHESMMVKNFSLEKIERPDEDARMWFYHGGLETAASYLRAFALADGLHGQVQLKNTIESDIQWMDELPAHLVLAKWRLVHAGYHPRRSNDHQGEEDLLWIRDAFHKAKEPIDALRTVVFGHTPTMGLHPKHEARWGEVWYSPVLLPDGRASSIGMDTCVFHKQNQPALLSALDLQTLEVRQIQRTEPWREDDWVRARLEH